MGRVEWKRVKNVDPLVIFASLLKYAVLESEAGHLKYFRTSIHPWVKFPERNNFSVWHEDEIGYTYDYFFRNKHHRHLAEEGWLWMIRKDIGPSSWYYRINESLIVKLCESVD